MAKLKLTDDLIEKICGIIAEGNYFKTATLAVGISETTFYRWKERGERAKSGIYRKFWESVKRAEAEAEQKYLGVIKDAANDGTWQAAAWYLERKHFDKWGKKEKHEVTGKDGGPLDNIVRVIEH